MYWCRPRSCIWSKIAKANHFFRWLWSEIWPNLPWCLERTILLSLLFWLISKNRFIGRTCIINLCQLLKNGCDSESQEKCRNQNVTNGSNGAQLKHRIQRSFQIDRHVTYDICQCSGPRCEITQENNDKRNEMHYLPPWADGFVGRAKINPSEYPLADFKWLHFSHWDFLLPNFFNFRCF